MAAEVLSIGSALASLVVLAAMAATGLVVTLFVALVVWLWKL